jgi:hypothetical protein
MLETMTETRPGKVAEQRTYSSIRTYNQLLETLDDEPRSVKVHPITEPLKVRLITKGPALRMWFARQLQKAMWNHLQTIPAFALTGHPLTHYDIEELDRRHSSLNITGMDNWVSGDYSAATDNLKIQYTKLSMETVFEKLRLPSAFLEPLRAVIYEQNLEYPKRYYEMMQDEIFSRFNKKDPSKEDELLFNFFYKSQIPGENYTVPQRTGQLMGSILSFPILCSCNLVAYWMTLEQYLGREIALKDLPVLVNGDDILFRTNDDFYSLWLENITEIGFQLSVGKNYVHPNYLMINSEPYWSTPGKLEKLRYYNIGLLSGRGKLARESDDSLAPVWDYYNKVVGGANNRVRAHFRFLSLNKEKVRRVTFDGLYNLFIDPYLGGLGFNLYPEVRPYIRLTTFQRQFGHFLLDQWKSFDKIPSKPLTLIQESRQERSVVTKYHYGNYKLLPYTQVGSLENPEYTLVLEEFQRIIGDYSVKKPIMSEVPYIGELLPTKGKLNFRMSNQMTVRQPSSSLLRNFRQNRPKILSVRPLLTIPRAMVETMVLADL